MFVFVVVVCLGLSVCFFVCFYLNCLLMFVLCCSFACVSRSVVGCVCFASSMCVFVFFRFVLYFFVWLVHYWFLFVCVFIRFVSAAG